MMLRDQFNYGKPIDIKFQDEVMRYFHHMWQNNRNNFLLSPQDQIIFSKLPRSCQLDLYNEFLFKEFLFKFRRFFSFRIALIQKQKDLQLKENHIQRNQIINKNLKKMKQLVHQMIRIQRNKKQQAKIKQMKELGLSHINESLNERNRQEQREEIERIRERLAAIEKKKREEYNKNKKH